MKVTSPGWRLSGTAFGWSKDQFHSLYSSMGTRQGHLGGTAEIILMSRTSVQLRLRTLSIFTVVTEGAAGRR